MSTIHTLRLLVATLLLGPSVVNSFQPLFVLDGESMTHREITQNAILHKTAEVCRDIAASEGREFSLTIDDTLSVSQVQKACASDKSSSIFSTVVFRAAIIETYLSNAVVDSVFAFSGPYHFDDETFSEGRDLITAGVSAVKDSVKLENYIIGRWTLGRVCHTLQDFYSHSNWVELENTAPFSSLIKPDQPLENLAGKDVETCRNCTGSNCTNNILPDVLQRGLITSGYFKVFSSEKPKGKCSHGGFFDWTSRKDPVGGINKDKVGSSHGSLHQKAANLAVSATMDLLENIRLAVGDVPFLRLMGLSQSSVLCFVIDTTGSMRDDIAEAKRVSFAIIDSKRGTDQEPSGYILVPFNDPDFGPVTMTTDADIFKERINALTATGGGDTPELCLSGLQLALTAAPPFSDIFVFTDAPAKDAHLKSTITALIESTKSEVTFMLTDVLASRRRRRSSQGGVKSRAIMQSEALLYRDLAQASGGQTIEVTKSDLSMATSVIEDSSSSAGVTVFQIVVNPGKNNNFTFDVDDSLQNMTIYVTGDSALTFQLTSPTGVSQASTETNGFLGSLLRVGNLRRLSIGHENQTGTWKISVASSSPYSVKVIGQSPVSFVYNLVEENKGAHGDFSLKEGRPFSVSECAVAKGTGPGGNASLLVSVTGSTTVVLADVSLYDSSGPTTVNGSIQSMGSGDFLVRFSDVPAGVYILLLKGEEGDSSSRSAHSSLQRQASTQIKTSSISVTAQVNNTSIEPGSAVTIPFTVATAISGVANDSATGNFTIRVNNDRGYALSAPTNLRIEAGNGGKANGTITLSAPSTASSGSAVTLTIEAENTADSDINYAILRFSVAAKVTDVTPPTCRKVSTSANCPSSSSSLCSSSKWEFIANITDGANGTGIERVSLRRGNGTVNSTTAVGTAGENITVVTYSSSCCSQSVELTAVDKAGNVATCVEAVRAVTTAAPVTTVAKTTSGGGHGLGISHPLWIGVVMSVLLK